MAKAETGTPPTLEEKVDERLGGGGVHNFNVFGEPIYKPIDAQPGDRELSLQTMLVRSPEDPVHINGQPFGIEVDETRLVDAISELRTSGSQKGRWEPRMVEISLGNSLLPHIDNGESEPDPVGFDRKTGILHVVVPAASTDYTRNTEGLASKVEKAANRDLEIAVNQIANARFRLSTRIWAFGGGLATGTLVGESAGYELIPDDVIRNSVGKGIVGALAGAAVVILPGLAANLSRESERDATNSSEADFKAAYEKAVKQPPALERPIISLVPVEE